MGKDLDQNQYFDLRLMVENCGLVAVLQSLSDICEAKSHPARSTPESSRVWQTAAGAVGVLSCQNNVQQTEQS